MKKFLCFMFLLGIPLQVFPQGDVTISMLHQSLKDQEQSTITLVINSLIAHHGDTAIVPVTVKFPEAKSYSSAELTFSYDSFRLNILDLDTISTLMGDSNWIYSWNHRDSITIATAGAKDISGEGTLFKLKFSIIDTTCEFPFIPIKGISAIFDTSSDAVSFSNGGIQLVPRYGDANTDRRVDTIDARSVLNHVVKLDTLGCIGTWNADVTRESTISALDAFLIHHYPDSLPFDTTGDRLKAEGKFKLSSDSTNWFGNKISVRLNLYDRTNIKSFEGTISLDPSHTLRFDSIGRHDLMNFYSINYDSTEGWIRFAVADSLPDSAPPQDTLTLVLCFTRTQSDTATITMIIDGSLRINETSIPPDTVSFILTDIGELQDFLPLEFKLSQNYPNPFNPATTIRYGLPARSVVRVAIYNVLGQVVSELVNGEQDAGYYDVQWTPNAPSGIYFYRVEAVEMSNPSKRFVDVKKMVLLR